MKQSILKFVFAALLIVLAFVAGQHLAIDAGQAPTMAEDDERKILYWVAPMDPNFRRDAPGKSPMGMDLRPVYADEAGAAQGVVRIDPAIVNNLGVKTAPAAYSSLPRIIDTVGYVGYDEETLHHIHTRVDGWIENLVTTAKGDAVKKGQLLFELYSPTLVSAQEEFLAALQSGNRTLLQASRDRIAALGVTVDEIERLSTERSVRQRIPVYAKFDGVVAHLGVRHGMYVAPAFEVMSIARLDSVWVLAEVLGRQSTWVEPGQAAVVTLDNLPGTRLAGTVDHVYPELDPVTRTLKLRLRFANPERRLRPNMFARVMINGKETGEIVHVPRQAVIRSERNNRVVLDIGDGHFEVRPVSIGIESGDRVAIRSGLQPGELVVTSAQFLIDSEANLDSALGRFGAAQ